MTIIYFFLFFSVTPLVGYKAVVTVPVADLVGHELSTKHAQKTYNKIPICSSGPHKGSVCPRLHQALLHEIVEVVQERGEQVCILLPSFFFITNTDATPQNKYWTLRRNMRPLDVIDLSEHQKLPPPISYKEPSHVDTPVVTLIYPWRDTQRNCIYSAGTRYVYDPSASTDTHWSVWLFDTAQNRCIRTSIDRTHAITAINNPACCIQQFVALLKQWANLTRGHIPYVWGGSSFTAACLDNDFVTHHHRIGNATTEIYSWPHLHTSPKTGFDCSGLVARAAQICNIPYYFKNTTTLATYLAPLTSNDTLKEGDLIWIAGHVMVVADLNNNTLIEARHYAHCYGKVHEIPLAEQFKNITTYEQLLECYFSQQELERLDNTGVVVEKIKSFKILKLASAWKYPKKY